MPFRMKPPLKPAFRKRPPALAGGVVTLTVRADPLSIRRRARREREERAPLTAFASQGRQHVSNFAPPAPGAVWHDPRISPRTRPRTPPPWPCLTRLRTAASLLRRARGLSAPRRVGDCLYGDPSNTRKLFASSIAHRVARGRAARSLRALRGAVTGSRRAADQSGAYEASFPPGQSACLPPLPRGPGRAGFPGEDTAQTATAPGARTFFSIACARPRARRNLRAPRASASSNCAAGVLLHRRLAK